MIATTDSWRPFLVLLVAGLELVACGDDDGAGADGSGDTVDAAAATGGSTSSGHGGGGGGEVTDVEPTRLGELYVARARLVAGDPDAPPSLVFLGSFEAEAQTAPPPETCEVSMMGSCSIRDCVRPYPLDGYGERPPSAFVGAGPITVGGLTRPLVVAQGDDGQYLAEVWEDPPQADWPFASGASIRFDAAGEVVPPFEAALHAPARVTNTSPALDEELAIPRDQPLVITWEHGPGPGRLAAGVITFEYAEDTIREVEIRCEGDVSDGAMTIPVELLARLEPDRGAMFHVTASETTEVVAGDWTVRATVADYTFLFEGVEVQ